MDFGEALAAALVQDADQIDHRIGASDRRGDRAFVAQAGGDRGDLADIAERLQEQRGVGMPHGDLDDPAASGQLLDQIPADEPGAAEYGDDARRHEAVLPALDRPRVVPGCLPERRGPDAYNTPARRLAAPKAAARTRLTMTRACLHMRASDAQVAELVDAQVSGTCGRKVVEVRVFSWAPSRPPAAPLATLPAPPAPLRPARRPIPAETGR